MSTRFVFGLAFWWCGGVTACAVPRRPDVLFIAIDELNDRVDFPGGHP